MRGSLIQVVEGDDLPSIKARLADSATGSPVDLSSAKVKVEIHRQGDPEVLAELNAILPNGGADGVFQFDFSAPTLLAGDYIGEVVCMFSQSRLTAFTPLSIVVRNKYA